jgi:lipid A oxidase
VLFRSTLFLTFATVASGEVYLGIYTGAAATRDTTVTVEQQADRLVFPDVPFSGRSFEAPIYYGYRIGCFLGRRFGLEAEFIHMKIHADVRRLQPYFQQFEVSHGLNMLLFNGVVRQPLVGDRLLFVARGGVGPTIPRPSVTTVSGSSSGSYQLGPIATQAAAGVEVRLWRGLHLNTEYKYTFTPASFDTPAGEARLHVHSHHGIAGFTVHF